MKTYKTMRIASALLVIALLSTCVISGTFAKYVTSASAKDAARVAKWGVVVSAWNTDAADKSVFASSYGTTVNAGADKVVAPGTETPTDGAIKFSVTGAPEVAVKLDFDMIVNSDVVVPAGDYLDWTTGNDTTDTFNVASDYYPVIFTLVDKDGVEVAKGNLAAIEAEFDALSEAAIAPNTDLAETYGEYTLAWEWVFESGNDEEDTLLGNNADGLAADADVVTDLDFEIAITATQID